jgi:hypothetical protein
MAAVERVQTASTRASRESSLVPNDRKASKGGLSSSATSVASSDADAQLDLASSGDGAIDKFKRRGSDDGQSETSSHRRKISKLFKGRRKRSQQEDVPPLPDHADDARFKSPGPGPGPDAEGAADPPPPFHQSEESLGLYQDVPSSLLADDSDAEK